jgi:hypothetical protein
MPYCKSILIKMIDLLFCDISIEIDNEIFSIYEWEGVDFYIEK